MSQFNIGDKVKCVTDKYANGQKHIDGKVGETYTISGMYDGEIHTYECDYIFEGHMLVNLEDIVTTPKSMLKDFMRVVDRKGIEYIFANGCIYSKGSGYNLIGNFDSELCVDNFNSLDIMFIYEPHVHDGYLLDPEKLGTLIWQRESVEDIAKKNKRFDLMASMKTLQTELDVMKKALEEME